MSNLSELSRLTIISSTQVVSSSNRVILGISRGYILSDERLQAIRDLNREYLAKLQEISETVVMSDLHLYSGVEYDRINNEPVQPVEPVTITYGDNSN